jgi:hypothetical protein
MNPDLCSKKLGTNHQRYGTDSMDSKKGICWQVEDYYMLYVPHKNFDFLLQNYTSNLYPQVFTASVSYMILAFGNKAFRMLNISLQLGEQSSCHLQDRCLYGDLEALIQIWQCVVWGRWRCDLMTQRCEVLSSRESPCGDAKTLATWI